MCDCCKAEGRNPKLMMGAALKMTNARLYKVYEHKVAAVTLCKLCDISLFKYGEMTFLSNNMNFARELYRNSGNFASVESNDYF